MKYCQKCGKELNDEAVVCAGCGCPVKGHPPKVVGKAAYEQAVKCSTVCNIFSGVLLVSGLAVAWFVSLYLGMVMVLATEILAVIPNTKLRSVYKKQNGPITDKKQFRSGEKALRKELKKQNIAYRLTMVFAVAGFVCVIGLYVLAVALGI